MAASAENESRELASCKDSMPPSNVFVMRAVAPGRTIAHNEAKAHRLLSTLIEACASEGARVGYLERGAIRCVTIVCTL
jgi:hypothetical protein